MAIYLRGRDGRLYWTTRTRDEESDRISPYFDTKEQAALWLFRFQNGQHTQENCK
jgi:hypothetical protein